MKHFCDDQNEKILTSWGGNFGWGDRLLSFVFVCFYLLLFAFICSAEQSFTVALCPKNLSATGPEPRATFRVTKNVSWRNTIGPKMAFFWIMVFLTAQMSVLMVFCGSHLPLAFQFVCGPGGGGATENGSLKMAHWKWSTRNGPLKMVDRKWATKNGRKETHDKTADREWTTENGRRK